MPRSLKAEITRPLSDHILLSEQAEEAAEYLNFLSGLPHPSTLTRRNRQPLLPPQQGRNLDRKTLVLDLDHTLIRSSVFSPQKVVKVRQQALKPSMLHSTLCTIVS